MTETFITGIVGAPFGLKGFVKIKPLSGEIEHLLKLTEVTLRQGGAERRLAIAESIAVPPAVAIRFSGYDSPEAAKKLSGAELIIGREAAAPLQDGEFYVEDLKELAVYAGGACVGQIAAIIEGGGGDLAEIRLENGETRLVPFKKEFFTGIDPENRRVVLTNTWILE